MLTSGPWWRGRARLRPYAAAGRRRCGKVRIGTPVAPRWGGATPDIACQGWPVARGGATRAGAREAGKIIPVPATAKAGEVTFNLNNIGKVEHEFVVIKTAKDAGDLLKGDEADETGAVGEDGSIKPGSTDKLKLKLKAGHYALICNPPGHYQAGQYANFDVS